MINKRLIGMMGDSKKHVVRNVAFQWIGMLANVGLMFAVGLLLRRLLARDFDGGVIALTAAVAIAAILVRAFCAVRASRESFEASRAVKKTLRGALYDKLHRLGGSYTEQVSTAEAVQVSVEGVEQLETYFGAYLPQFFYAMLAPVTLFAVLAFVSFKAAIILLACVPLIPVTIALVQTFAKKLLAKYWGKYTTLGDTFLENLQGLTTLKIYRADGRRHAAMNEEAETFRRVTMKVLTMQLNSITIMDLVAFGGAALGVIVSTGELAAGRIDIMGCFAIILLAAEFFIPMRTLGSYFHIAMNGMAASEKIFRILDLEEPPRDGEEADLNNHAIRCKNLSYSYDGERPVLRGVDAAFQPGSFTAVVGESGCGKSTLAGVLMGRNRMYDGTVTLGGKPLGGIAEESLLRTVTLVSHNSHLFKGTVRDTLRMASPGATDEQCWQALEAVRLDAFLRDAGGLDTALLENAGNLSGGQRQRLAMARALLHDSPVYIFDEATSNVDVESEAAILDGIAALKGRKTVILITHRLLAASGADVVYVLKDGTVAGHGRHKELLDGCGEYRRLWETQQQLEQLLPQEQPMSQELESFMEQGKEGAACIPNAAV